MSNEALLVIPKRQGLSDDLYDALKQAIAAGRLPAGSRINLEELRRETGVSNTPIRHALSRLEAEGLVVKSAYRGFAVCELPDDRMLEEIFEARLVLEPATSAFAATRAPEADLRFLREITAQATADPHGSAALDGVFHKTIAAVSGNSILNEELERVWERRLSRNIYGLHDNPEVTWAEHGEIAEALLARDADGASQAMRRHLEHSRERYRAQQRP